MGPSGLYRGHVESAAQPTRSSDGTDLSFSSILESAVLEFRAGRLDGAALLKRRGLSQSLADVFENQRISGTAAESDGGLQRSVFTHRSRSRVAQQLPKEVRPAWNQSTRVRVARSGVSVSVLLLWAGHCQGLR